MSDKPPAIPPLPTVSQVEAASPVAGASSPLTPMKLTILICAIVAVLLIAPHVFQLVRDSFRSQPKQVVEPAAGAGQQYQPPPIPPGDQTKATNVVAREPIMPADAVGGLGRNPQIDPRIAARLSDIGGSGGGSSGGAVAEGLPKENKRTGPDLPDAGSVTPLAKELTPTKLVASRATEVSNPFFTIEQGRVLQCTLVTKINTSLPGGVTAELQDGAKGETGDVMLLNPGSRVFGTIEHGMVNGLDRAFVLWQNITTPVMYDAEGLPHQLRVAVDSPASDAIGQGGVGVDVNHHYLQKFGAAFGFSLLQGGLQMATAGLAGGGGGGAGSFNSNYLNFNSDSQVASQALSAQINIPDVGTRNQGSSCGIYVMRDLYIPYKLKVR